jgi:hypothetical protein
MTPVPHFATAALCEFTFITAFALAIVGKLKAPGQAESWLVGLKVPQAHVVAVVGFWTEIAIIALFVPAPAWAALFSLPFLAVASGLLIRSYKMKSGCACMGIQRRNRKSAGWGLFRNLFLVGIAVSSVSGITTIEPAWIRGVLASAGICLAVCMDFVQIAPLIRDGHQAFLLWRLKPGSQLPKTLAKRVRRLQPDGPHAWVLHTYSSAWFRRHNSIVATVLELEPSKAIRSMGRAKDHADIAVFLASVACVRADTSIDAVSSPPALVSTWQ